MKTWFSKVKLIKQFGNSLFLRGLPLSTKPPIPEQFFHDLPLCLNFKNKKPPTPYAHTHAPTNFRGDYVSSH